MNESEYRDFIVRILNEWYEKNYREINSSKDRLIENEDYQLLVSANPPYDQVSITCSCKVKVQLAKVRGNICLSNYYKHLKSKSCLMMKKKSINFNVSNDSNTTDPHERLDDETSIDISMKEATSFASSSTQIDSAIDTVQSLKRSISQRNKIVAKRQRL